MKRKISCIIDLSAHDKTEKILTNDDTVDLLYGTFFMRATLVTLSFYSYWFWICEMYMHSNLWLKPHYKYTSSGWTYAELIGTGIRKEHINFYMTCIIIFYVCYMTTVMHLDDKISNYMIYYIHSFTVVSIISISINPLIYFSEIDVCWNYLMNIVHNFDIFFNYCTF